MRAARLVSMILSVAGAVSAASDDDLLSLTLDRPDALYGRSDRAVVHVSHRLKVAPTNWSGAVTVTRDMQTVLQRRDWDLNSGPITLELGLDAPGQLTVEATVGEKGGRHPAHRKSVGLLFDPKGVELSTREPEDFDAFWAGERAAWRTLVREATLTPREPSPDPAVVVYDLQVAIEGEAPVSGLLSYPRGAKPASLPALLAVQGAGRFRASLPGTVDGAQRGFLSLQINPHGLPNDRPGDYYDAVRTNELAGYTLRGVASRETWYFKKMFLRVVTALDYLAGHPLWNGRDLMLLGSSQGGAQALAGAALDPRVTAVAVGCPALCDLNGATRHRQAGWPNPLKAARARQLAPETVANTVRYYDMGIFARRIRAPAFVVTGLIDSTCPAVGVHAMVNNLRGPVTVQVVPDEGHALSESIGAMRDFLDANRKRSDGR